MRPSRGKTTITFNVLVTGHASVGKTALITTLSQSIGLQDEIHGYHQIEKVILSNLMEPMVQKELHCQETSGRHKLRVHLIDSPGVRIPDDKIESSIDGWLNPLNTYIEQQYESFFQEETKVKRNTRQADKRVHACIYMLDPHVCADGLSATDCKILTLLMTKVNLILVLGKGDTLSLKEKNRIMTRISADIQKEKIKVFEIFAEEEEGVVQEPKKALSWVLFNGEMNDETKELLFHRTFLWGKAEVLNPDHSDFLTFKQTIFEDCVQELMDLTKEELYEVWRTNKLMRSTAVRHLEKQRSLLADRDIMEE